MIVVLQIRRSRKNPLFFFSMSINDSKSKFYSQFITHGQIFYYLPLFEIKLEQGPAWTYTQSPVVRHI